MAAVLLLTTFFIGVPVTDNGDPTVSVVPGASGIPAVVGIMKILPLVYCKNSNFLNLF
jgi:hypothetical protein